MKLKGKNLGERQKDLNYRVFDAVEDDISFDIIKGRKEISDVDVLFKIDVAAAKKNVEYILDILKSEDTLHITRALKKCDWLFDDEHSHLICIYYLHQNIFPHMSPKMKRKMLTIISRHVRDENQAETFYNYCKSEEMQNLSKKFLLNTSKSFKLSYIEEWDGHELNIINKANLKYFLGNSFALAEAYLKKQREKSKPDNILSDIIYLYKVSNKKYLYLLEKYSTNSRFFKLGVKVTKDIAKKHKNRVMAKLEIYVLVLQIKTLVKHSNLEEIKQYASFILSTFKHLWQEKQWNTNDFLLKPIPAEEKFEFVKGIFTKTFPGESFETSDEFWTRGYYNIMTTEQRIEATKNDINAQSDVGIIKRNVWYTSVQFDKALSTFEHEMANNKDRTLRINLLTVLIKASKSDQDLLQVLNYYQTIYNEESLEDKKKFINTVIAHHEVFNLDANCWKVLQRMLLNENVRGVDLWPKQKYESFVYFYQILHNKEFPDDVKTFLDRTYLCNSYAALYKMDERQSTMVLEYLYHYHVNRLYELDDIVEYDLDMKVKKTIDTHVIKIIYLIFSMRKTKDDIPKIAQNYILANWDTFQRMKFPTFNDNVNFAKRLKQDASTVLHFHTLRKKIEDDKDFTLVPVMRKIKVYFSRDIAKRYLDFFKATIPNESYLFLDNLQNQRRVLQTAIIGIYMLAGESYKSEIMSYFKPKKDRIDEIVDGRNRLHIQESICRFAYFSRPPVPFSCVKMYLRGEFARFCLPTIGALLANLPTTSCIKMAESILSTPNSMLKYSFHLVLHRLSVKDLQDVVIRVLKKTKHDWVRRDLFALVCRASLFTYDNTQEELMDCFKEMVSSVPEYDVNCFKNVRNMKHSWYVDEDVKGELLLAYKMRGPKERFFSSSSSSSSSH